jgi:uncharacterized protein YdeI (BOF family)
MPRWIVVLAALTVTSAGAGCGGSSGASAPRAPSKAPAAEKVDSNIGDDAGDRAGNKDDGSVDIAQEEEITTVDAAARAFEQAEASLDGSLLAALDDDADAMGDKNGERVGADQPSPPKQAPAPVAKPTAKATGMDRCVRVCRALASMRRASDRLCGLTGGDDPRCSNCRERVDRAEDRVQRSCSSCG